MDKKEVFKILLFTRLLNVSCYWYYNRDYKTLDNDVFESIFTELGYFAFPSCERSSQLNCKSLLTTQPYKPSFEVIFYWHCRHGEITNKCVDCATPCWVVNILKYQFWHYGVITFERDCYRWRRFRFAALFCNAAPDLLIFSLKEHVKWLILRPRVQQLQLKWDDF